jgi:recombination protein RecA
VEVRRTTAIKDGETVTGNRTKIKIVKNKIAAPFREVEVDILYGKGISREGDTIDLGSQHNVLEKSGSWYSYKGERIGQGRDNARQTLLDKPELCRSIESDLRHALGLNGTANVPKIVPEFALVTPSEKRSATAAS